MGSSTLRTRPDDERRSHGPMHAASDANDDVEAWRSEPTKRSARGLRRRWRHYIRRSKFPGTILPHASSTAALARRVSMVGSTLGGLAFTIMGGLLSSSTTDASTDVRAVDVTAVAAVADVKEGAAGATSLADDVINWTIADTWATNTSMLCCVLVTQATARGSVDAEPLPFLPPSSPTQRLSARFRPGPSIRFGFLAPLTHTTCEGPRRRKR